MSHLSLSFKLHRCWENKKLLRNTFFFFGFGIKKTQVTEFDNKGRGVTTVRPLRSGDFVLEYAGELIDHQEARLREQLYAADKSVGCYMYYFSCRNKQYW